MQPRRIRTRTEDTATLPYFLLAASLSVLVTATASAQSIPREPDPARVRLQIGPLLLNPTLALTNAGLDTNVLNEAESAAPARDFTIALSPASDWWLRMGRTWLLGNVRQDLVWYQTFAAERSVSGGYTVGWLVPLNRLSFAVSGNWLNTRQRPGFEIDARSRRHEIAGTGAVEIRALSRTFFGARAERRAIDFDRAAVFRGSLLEAELNRTVTAAALTMRNQLTPLTNVSVAVAREEERFEFSSLRDSDSIRYDFALNFDPFALINGSAQIGFRDFKPLSPDVPGYRGSTAQVDLSYVALGSTKVGLTVSRDIQYSHDVNQPYYLQTGFTGSLGQQIYGPIDAEGRVGAHRLEYSDRAQVAVAVSNRVDRIRSYGFGVGYRLGLNLRVGFNVDKQKRLSELSDREYEGLRYGFAMAYGL